MPPNSRAFDHLRHSPMPVARGRQPSKAPEVPAAHHEFHFHFDRDQPLRSSLNSPQMVSPTSGIKRSHEESSSSEDPIAFHSDSYSEPEEDISMSAVLSRLDRKQPRIDYARFARALEQNGISYAPIALMIKPEDRVRMFAEKSGVPEVLVEPIIAEARLMVAKKRRVSKGKERAVEVDIVEVDEA
jgi:hypothetical protein